MIFRLKLEFFLAIFLFAAAFFIYLLGVSSSVYGGDSGDVILAAYFGGVAHPPGYPLNSLLGFLFTHLPIAGSIAYRTGLMMAFFSAGTLAFLFLSLRNLTKSYFIALTASLALAFTPLFWLYAHVTEVFQLNLLLISASFYFLTLWITGVAYKKEIRIRLEKWLFLSIFFLGLAVFHHQTSVLVLPAYLYLIHKTQRTYTQISKKAAVLGLTFLLGGIPYLAVPLLALRHTPVNWDYAVNVGNLLHLITRADYGTFAASQDFVGMDYKARLLQVASYLAFLKSDFGLIGSFFIILGAVYTFFKERKLFWFLILAVFVSGPIFLFYSSFSLSSDFLFGIWERFILLSYFFLTIDFAFGLLFLYQVSPKIFKRIKLKKELGLLILGLSFFLIPLYMFRTNWPKADMSGFQLGDWLGHDVLVSSEPGSLIFLFDDTTAFNTEYIYYTSDRFRDRKIVLGGILRHFFYRQQLAREYPDLTFPLGFFDTTEAQSAAYMEQLIRSNINKVPIYTVSYSPKIEGYGWVVSGLLKKLVPEGEIKDKEYIRELNEKAFASMEMKGNYPTWGYSNFIEQSIKRFYSFSFNEVGDQMLVANNYGDAKKYYTIALLIQPDDPRASFGVGRSDLELGECQEAKDYLEKSYRLNKTNVRVLNELADEARRCESNEALAKQYDDEAQRLLRSQMEKLQ